MKKSIRLFYSVLVFFSTFLFSCRGSFDKKADSSSSLAPVPFKLFLALFASYNRVCASAVALRSVLGPSSVGIDRNGLFYFSH
jgi:hypothetical protein